MYFLSSLLSAARSASFVAGMAIEHSFVEVSSSDTSLVIRPINEYLL
jgi:hypothetical protein